MKFKLYSVLQLCAVALLPLGLMAAADIANAQAFPAKTITLIAPFPPGGANDTVARIIAPKLSERLGQTVIVENLPGANGAVALNRLKRSDADGHTLLLTTVGPVVTNPHIAEGLPFDTIEDFDYITNVAETESLLVVHPSLEANTLEELIELSKQRELRFGVSGLGGQPHIIIENLKRMTGAKITIVPYNGSAAVNDVVAGHVDGTIFDMPQLISLVKENRLKALAILSHKKQSDFLPEVPSIGAKPEFAGLISHSWIKLMGPAGIPDAVKEQLRSAIEEAVHQSDTVESFRKVALTPLTSASSSAADEEIAKEYAYFEKVIAETGVKGAN